MTDKGRPVWTQGKEDCKWFLFIIFLHWGERTRDGERERERERDGKMGRWEEGEWMTQGRPTCDWQLVARSLTWWLLKVLIIDVCLCSYVVTWVWILSNETHRIKQQEARGLIIAGRAGGCSPHRNYDDTLSFTPYQPSLGGSHPHQALAWRSPTCPPTPPR